MFDAVSACTVTVAGVPRLLEEAICVVIVKSEVLVKVVSKDVDKVEKVEGPKFVLTIVEAVADVVLAAKLLTVLAIVKRGEKLRSLAVSAWMAMA